MSVFRGVVRGKAVVLPDNARLEEGTEVEVRPLAEAESLEELAERAFEQRLFEEGLLTEIKVLSRVAPEGKRTPIKVKGKPLSQVIIEERR